MGSAASTIPDEGINIEQYKSLAGEHSDEEWFNENMDSAGLVSKEKLLKRHTDAVPPEITRYILVQRTKKIILTEHRDGGLCFTVKQPMEKIDAGTVLEVDRIDVVFKTHVARGVIESHCLHLTDDTGWVLGWNTTINGEQVVDMLVTSEDGKPVVVHPVPNHKRRSKHPVTRPSDHDEAAALIQKMTRSRQDRRRRRELAAHPMTRLFGERLLTKNGEQAVLLALEGKTHIGIFFSAQWCPKCAEFTPKLLEMYEKIAKEKPFEIIYHTGDADASKFDEYYQTMPWLAVPFAAKDVMRRLGKKYNTAGGIPLLVVVGVEDGALKDMNGTNTVLNAGGDVAKVLQTWQMEQQ